MNVNSAAPSKTLALRAGGHAMAATRPHARPWAGPAILGIHAEWSPSSAAYKVPVGRNPNPSHTRGKFPQIRHHHRKIEEGEEEGDEEEEELRAKVKRRRRSSEPRRRGEEGRRGAPRRHQGPRRDGAAEDLPRADAPNHDANDPARRCTAPNRHGRTAPPRHA